ncbi:GAF domain-containing protein [Roseivirga sp.]|uniref:GAF domain-containing protein n=1 Tax=Roseivirga sp. TaxID=1964215 RepID=UPI003B52AA87
MAEELLINNTATKAEKYESLLPQIEALVTGEPDLTANLANIASALKYGMGFFWVGFYLVKEGELVLGPFQGPIACTRIRKGKGVCGTSWEKGETVLVPNVDEFPGHIACSSDSKSEIVLPAFKHNEVALILDVDSDQLNDFDTVDQEYLEKLMRVIDKLL